MAMAELNQDIDWYLERLEGVEGGQGQFGAWCPCHDDIGTSVKGLSITQKGAKLLMKCWSCGATLPDVYEALSGESPYGDVSMNVTRVHVNGDAPEVDDEPLGGGMAWWITKTGVRPEVWAALGCVEHKGGVAFEFGEDMPVKYRRPPQNAGDKGISWDSRGADTPPLWPVPMNECPEHITITEGESDCGTAHAAGLPFAFAVTSGAKTPLPHGWASAFASRGVAKVTIVGDTDEPGMEFVARLSRQATGAGLAVEVIRLSDIVDPFSGINDLNGVWRACETIEEFNELVLQATHIVAEKIPLLTAQQMEVIAEEEVNWLIPDLIAAGDKIILSAPQKSLKSWVTLDLVRALTEKKAFLKKPDWTPKKRVKVLYVQEEGSRVLWAIRVAMLRLKNSEYSYFAHKTGFKFTEASYTDELIATVRQNMLDMVILDPMQRMIPGLNENDSNETGLIWDEIARLQEACPWLVVMIVHHANKMATLAWESIRGSGRHGGEVDLGIFLAKHPNEENTLQMWLDGRDIPQYVSQGETVYVKYTLDRENRIFEIDATEVHVNVTSPQQRQGKENRKAVWAAISNGADTKTRIMEETELSEATVRQHLDVLIEAGEVEEIDNGKGKAKTYKVKGE